MMGGLLSANWLIGLQNSRPRQIVQFAVHQEASDFACRAPIVTDLREHL